MVEPRGYVLVFVGKNHHLADCRGYAYEHRIENIELLTKVEHGRVHISKLKRDLRGRLLPKERLSDDNETRTYPSEPKW